MGLLLHMAQEYDQSPHIKGFYKLETVQNTHMRVKKCPKCNIHFHRDLAAAQLIATLTKRLFNGEALPEQFVRYRWLILVNTVQMRKWSKECNKKKRTATSHRPRRRERNVVLVKLNERKDIKQKSMKKKLLVLILLLRLLLRNIWWRNQLFWLGWTSCLLRKWSWDAKTKTSHSPQYRRA